jgi:hypothetical protein
MVCSPIHQERAKQFKRETIQIHMMMGTIHSFCVPPQTNQVGIMILLRTVGLDPLDRILQ